MLLRQIILGIWPTTNWTKNRMLAERRRFAENAWVIPWRTLNRHRVSEGFFWLSRVCTSEFVTCFFSLKSRINLNTDMFSAVWFPWHIVVLTLQNPVKVCFPPCLLSRPPVKTKWPRRLQITLHFTMIGRNDHSFQLATTSPARIHFTLI